MSKTLTLFTVAAILFGSAPTFADRLEDNAKEFVKNNKEKIHIDYLDDNHINFDIKKCTDKENDYKTCESKLKTFENTRDNFIISQCRTLNNKTCTESAFEAFNKAIKADPPAEKKKEKMKKHFEKLLKGFF